MGAVSPTHLVIVLIVAVLILGPGKLPETGEALGKAVRELRRAVADDMTTPPQALADGSAEGATTDGTPLTRSPDGGAHPGS